jgi:hypothetical protein
VTSDEVTGSGEATAFTNEDKDERQGRKEIEGEYGKPEEQNGRASIGTKGEY